MSEAIIIPQAERATELHQQLLSLSGEVTYRFFEMGEIMKEIRDNDYWKIMGYDTFESYFSDPELAQPKSSVYHAIALVENFPDWKENPPYLVSEGKMLPISKLIQIIPHLTETNKPKLLEMARGLSRSDLQHELEALGTPISPGYQQLPKIYRCNTCQGIKGIFPKDLCRCGWTEDQLDRLQKLVNEVNSI